MTRLRLLALFALLAVGLAAVAGWAWSRQVRLVRFSPAGGLAGAAAVPITAPLRLTFSTPMDPASVRAHLHLEPETPLRVVAAGRDIVFQPAAGLAPGTTYTVTLDPGAAGLRGAALGRGGHWQFRTRPPALLYLTWPAQDTLDASGSRGPAQIYVAALDGSPPRSLTAEPGGVWDFAADPLGSRVVYSAVRDDAGTDLWLLSLDADRRVTKTSRLLACPGEACLAPAWSADGRHLAFERRELLADGPNLDPKAGHIWLLDVETGRDRPLFDYDVPLHSPVWSPALESVTGAAERGSLSGIGSAALAYVSPLVPAIEVLDLATDDIVPIPNEWGAAPVWSPDGRSLVLPDLALLDEPEALVVHLFQVDISQTLAAGEAANLTASAGDQLLVKDTGPAWSPGGGWIAFGRQSFEGEQWTPGRQIWLMRPGASAGEAYSLVRQPLDDLFGLVWRPDGGALAYLSTDLSEGVQVQPKVEVWLFDFETRRSTLVAAGVLARWLP